MAVQYQVTGACAHATVDGPAGRRRQLHFKGTLLPPDVPKVEIDHLLSVRLIQAVGGPAPVAVAAPAGPPPETLEAPEPGTGDTGGDAGETGTGEGDDTSDGDDGAEADPPASDEPPAADPDVEAKRAAARAKLPTDGSKPDGRAGQPVWVEYMVANGYDYAAVAKADKKELVELASQL